jgi:rod shape determining protein RodA
MQRSENLVSSIDWLTILLYFLIVLLGWLNIYAAVYDEGTTGSIFDFSLNSGRQLVWIVASVIIIIFILIIDFKFYSTFAYFIYGAVFVVLLGVLGFGTEIAGSKSWIRLGSFGVQPSEFMKFAAALAVAKFMDSHGVKFNNFKDLFILGAFIALPMGLIVLQGDTGTALIFGAFILVFYREGLSPLFLIFVAASAAIFLLALLVTQSYLAIGIGASAFLIILLSKKNLKTITGILLGAAIVFSLIRSVDYVFTNVLKPHQQNRIKALINPEEDPLGYGWNVTQSKIAIGSGGMWGKGFLEGTQTKFDFVPEQSTDFIFCTIGEEHGWFGTLILITLFMLLFLRIVYISERQKTRFARVYGYSVVAILFFHFAINIGMTIGLFPVIGIPLPFFSYGGSSLWAFTCLLFVLIKLDAHRMDQLVH